MVMFMNTIIGDLFDEKTRIGPLTRKMQLSFIEDQVADAVEKGAKVVLGGKRVANSAGYFFEPTVVIDCNHTMKLMQEEVRKVLFAVDKLKECWIETNVINNNNQ